MTQATPKDYWISPNALYIELNALDNPDYIQASCVSGAQILVYVKDIIGYDAGHNYRRWPLQAAPTVFNSHTEKYLYVAIPRDTSLAASAWVVFPSELLDIYGKNEQGVQIGNEKYYYIFLQGIIMSSGDNGTEQRKWKEEPATGYLSSDEAVASSQYKSNWYEYSNVSDIVTFLKDLTMKDGTTFKKLFADLINIQPKGSLSFDGQSLTGVANALATPDTNTDKIVTPNFVSERALSKLHADTAQELITFLKGLAVGDGKKGIDAEGVATLKAVLSEGFKSAAGVLGSGFWLGEKEDADGNAYSYIEVDRMLVRKVAEFVQLMIRDIRHVGGQIVLTPAAVECTSVDRIGADGQFLVPGSTAEVAAYRCYFRTEQDGKAVTNDFAVGDLARCQTFNMKATGLTLNGANRYYWRKVTAVGDYYIDLSNTDYDKSVPNSEPQAGDEIVQMGSAEDTSRQGVIMLSAYGSDAPKIALYRGVDGYSLSGKAVVSLSKDEVMIIADRLMYTTGDGKTQSVADGLGTLTKSVATITAGMGKIETRVTNTENTVTKHGDELAKMDSKIEQTAGRISMEVSRTVQGMENMLEGSTFDPYAEGPVVTAQRVVDGYKGVGGIMAHNTTSTSLQGARWYGSGKQGNIHVEKGKTYTFGVWVKSGGTNGTVRVDVVWQGGRTDTSRPGGMTGPGGSGSLISAAATTEWELLTATFTVAEDARYEWVEVYLFNRSGDGSWFATTFSRPILAEGDAYHGWGLAPGEKSDTENKLFATGIDIENQIITATADTFEIRNNSGELTASVNEDGLFETNDAIIKGTVMARNGYFSGFVMKEPCIITPDNIKDYGTISTESAYGYATLDFTKTGSYIVVNGDFSSVIGSSNELVLVLPYGGTGNGTTTTLPDGTTIPLPQMLRYMDQKIIVVNASKKGIGVNSAALVGTVQGYPRDSSIAVSQMAVLEPTISLSGSATSGKYTYTVGWKMSKANIKS